MYIVKAVRCTVNSVHYTAEESHRQYKSKQKHNVECTVTEVQYVVKDAVFVFYLLMNVVMM